MKRRLLSAFLAVMMVLTMAPVAFAADAEPTTEPTTEYVAQVDGNNYATIADAIAAANNKTLTLLKDVNGQIVIPEGKKITLDLNGHAISNSRTAVLNNGNLTICDSSEKKSGVIKSTGNVGIGVGDNSYTTIEYANIQSQEGAVITSYSTGATIIIKDGVFSAADNSVVAGNGSKRDGNANVITINGGTFIGNIQSSGFIACGIYAPWKDIITVNGGNFTVNNGIGIVARAGQVTVNGGTFTCTGSAKGGVGDKKFDMDAAQCVYFDASNPAYPAYNSETDYIKLQGGKFSSDVSAYVAKGYVQNENGTVEQLGETNAVAKVGNTYYKTLSAAVAVAKDGDTVTLLNNTVEDVVIPAGKTITLDLNGKNIKPATGDAIVNKGNLTIVGSGEVAAQKSGSAAIANFPDATANVNGGTFVSAYWYVIKNLGNMTIDGPVTIKKPEGNTDTSSLIDNGWYGSTDKVAGESVSAQADKAKLTIKSGEFTGKSGSASCSVIKNDDYATLDISGGTFDSTNNQNTSNATTILNWNVATISGGTFIGQYPLANGAYNNAADKGQFTISGGTFTGLKSVFGYGQGGDGVGKITITDGNFAAPAFGDWGSAYTMEISGGYFTVDPSAYCVTGKTGVASDKDGYKYKVGTVEVKDENKITTDTQKGATKANLGSAIADTDKTNATDVGKSVTPTKLADTTPITADDKAQALTELVKNKKVTLNQDGTIPQDTTVTVVKETYLDVTVTAYDTTSNTVSMNIAPKYNLIAVAKTGTNEEKVTLESAQDAKVGSTEVTVILPEAFKGQKVYINHNNGANLYVATADESGKITFTTNGFSPFTFALTNPDVVAEVNGNAYKSLQDAANAAKDGDEITVVQNKNLDLTFNTTKSVKVTNKTDDKITVKFNGTNKDVAKNATETFSYTKPSSGSSGGSSSGKTTYKVTTSAVNNGGVNASPSNAEKGATITITLSPDKGYKLDKLTVTDGSGKSVSTVKKSDTVYTFTMPASAVKVGVSYVKATETPSETKFNDVSANDWFASAVDYVTGKGMMNGTAANTFSPKANTTRGMLMTVLARHAGEDTTGGSVWYEKGMNWAKANGVSDGTNPQVNITREQLAAMLYRYAQYKKYDVSGAKSLDGYTDAQSVSSYAVPALQWANAAGVVTGKSGSKLDPKGNATRAEVAAMLMRFCENVK